MIIQLRKNCQQTINRALLNLQQIRKQACGQLSKQAKRKLNLAYNDIELLKDNFLLLAAKIIRSQLKFEQKQATAKQIQMKHQSKCQQLSKTVEKLQIKNLKLEKQKDFIAFINKNLKKQLNMFEKNNKKLQKFQKIFKQIEQFASHKSDNLSQQLNKLIIEFSNENTDDRMSIQYSVDLNLTSPLNKQKCKQEKLLSIGFVSTERTPIKSSIPMNSEKKPSNSCQLGVESTQKLKTKFQNTRYGSELKKSFITEQKRLQLAKLIESQNKFIKSQSKVDNSSYL